jgi:heme exporter protein B
MLYLSALFGLVYKDLRIELRGRETVGSILMLAAVMLVAFHFALGESTSEQPSVSVGALWVSLLFAAVLGQSRTFLLEREGGCLVGLMLTPADRSAIYLAKVAVNLLFLLAVEAVIVPLFIVLYGVPLGARPVEAAALFLGASVGLTVVGTLVSSLGLSGRNRELLLPILPFPLLMPVLIGAVEGTVSLVPGASTEPLGTWLRLIVLYDVLFLAVSVMLFDFALSD